MDDTLHYLIMANQMLVQKSLLEQLKDTGLTIGQPKILDYLKDHDGSNQKEIARACFLEAGSLTTNLNKMEEKAFAEIEKKALADVKEEELEQFMSVYHRIYDNLSSILENRQKNDTLTKKEGTCKS